MPSLDTRIWIPITFEQGCINAWKRSDFIMLTIYRMTQVNHRLGWFQQRRTSDVQMDKPEQRGRNAIAQIWASAHTLAIERGHHTRRKTPIQERLCKSCGVIEDEVHFILSCHINQNLRVDLIKNIVSIYPEFRNMTENEQIYLIFNNEDRRILTWLGKSLHNLFMLRRILLS